MQYVDSTFRFASPSEALPDIFGDQSDLNHDQKLDLVLYGTVFLGNGDGTFQKLALGLSGQSVTLADLNGDGNLDIIQSNVTNSVYACRGPTTIDRREVFDWRYRPS